MPSVQILSPDVIAKIAAGEVVDRPASVVKELIENGLDAKATSIEVHLKDAGKELIHIKDNGTGITKADLNNLFNRHATSKIKNIEDLETLLSMGFRGEALYSIAAVADVTLSSQAIDTTDAWEIHVRGGQRLKLEPCATRGHGTDIKIAELFFNTPARRKFLKSSTSELNGIVTIVLHYALLYPNHRFLLTNAGKTLIDLKPQASGKDRMAKALNLNPKDLLETSQDFPEDQIFIKAVLSNINISRNRRDMQYFFINHRPIESKSLSFAMNDMYRTLLPPGAYPAFILSIALDPANVDANIHPSKKEVRITQEGKIIAIVRHLVEHTLMNFGGTKIIDHTPISQGLPADRIIFGPTHTLPTTLFDHAISTQSDVDLFNNNASSMIDKFARARYIGAFNNKFLLFEDGTSLLCVDQHAAQERIMFERFSKQIDSKSIEVQPLLTPVVIKLSVHESVNIEEYAPKLQEVGIEASLLDEQTLAIHSQPVLLKNIESAVRSLLVGDTIARCDRNTIARRACKASIVAGDRLSPQEVEHQRNALLMCDEPFTCPHGRPILIELSESFLDKQFLRT